MPSQRRLAPALALLAAILTVPAARADDSDWIARSDVNSEVLLDVMARFNPEQAGFFGIEGLDEEITQIPLDLNDQQVQATEAALATLRQR